LLALSALILAWSGVGGLIISVIRIKYLARRSGTVVPPNLSFLFGRTNVSNPVPPASDFFQFFNPSNACLQVIDLIGLFPPKHPLILKKVPL